MSKEKRKIGIPTGASSGTSSQLEIVAANAGEVAKATALIITMPFGIRPRRVHTDPSQDGARQELLRPLGVEDLFHPKKNS
jgi:hypothetical protein